MKDMLTPLFVALVVGGIVYVIDDRPIHPLLLFLILFISIYAVERIIHFASHFDEQKNKRHLCFRHTRTFYRRKSSACRETHVFLQAFLFSS
ncbi:hypothetical protein ACEQPO_11385 [Bacillus sp. SL00103]